MSFTVLRLGAKDADLFWPRVEPFLRKAIQRARGLYEPEDIRERVTDPKSGWVLWSVHDGETLRGAWITAIECYPRDRMMLVPFAGGKGVKEWFDLARDATEQFKEQCGITRPIRSYGRRGWERFGMKAIGHILERRA